MTLTPLTDAEVADLEAHYARLSGKTPLEGDCVTVARLLATVKDLKAVRHNSHCAYCRMSFGCKTMGEAAEHAKAHAAVCEKNPMRELERRLAQAELERDGERKAKELIEAGLASTVERADGMKHRIRELEGVVKPFAGYAPVLVQNNHPDEMRIGYYVDESPTVGDCVHAAAVLAKGSP